MNPITLEKRIRKELRRGGDAVSEQTDRDVLRAVGQISLGSVAHKVRWTESGGQQLYIMEGPAKGKWTKVEAPDVYERVFYDSDPRPPYPLREVERIRVRFVKGDKAPEGWE